MKVHQSEMVGGREGEGEAGGGTHAEGKDAAEQL